MRRRQPQRHGLPAPGPQGRVYAQLQKYADQIAAHLAPRTGAYHEIWLNGQPVAPQAVEETEPIYGKVYLPRKFKIGFALPEDNSSMSTLRIWGSSAWWRTAGSGFQHAGRRRHGHVARQRGHVSAHGPADLLHRADQVVSAAEAVVKLFRDHGNRADRKRARIKYLVHDWGVERFRESGRLIVPFPVQMPKPVEVTGFDLRLGWRPQGDGRWFYGLSIENGRIKDEGSMRLADGAAGRGGAVSARRCA